MDPLDGALRRTTASRPSRWLPLAPRVLLSVGAGVVALFAVEGGLSLIGGRSLRPRGVLDLERIFTARALETVAVESSRSAFAGHEDPRVGYALKPGRHELLRAPITVDDLGVRGRPASAGPVPAGARRIVVLGDSVAFGLGVADDETLAARLEHHLNDVRGPGDPPVACFTVAVPGWNCRSAVFFLQDHLERYRPDLVVHVPVANDLVDSFGVNEDGHRRMVFDPFARDPLLRVTDEHRLAYQLVLLARVQRGEAEDLGDARRLGPAALHAGLTRESLRRHHDNAGWLVELHDALAARGARLAVLWYFEAEHDNAYVWRLRRALRARLPDLLEIPGLAHIDESFTLGFDGHANAECLDALARCVANDLLASGAVAHGAGPPPRLDVAPRFAAARAAPRSDEELEAIVASLEERDLDLLQGTVDVTNGRGSSQVIGGLNPDGTMGPRLLAALRRQGGLLRVRLAGLDDGPVPAPLRVAVEVEGVVLGMLAVPGGEGHEVAETFALPAGLPAAIEVRLVPSGWKMRPFQGRWFPAACRVIEISCDDA